MSGSVTDTLTFEDGAKILVNDFANTHEYDFSKNHAAF